MILAITDACIFIDLCELQFVEHFFKLDIEIHTSYDVFNELYEDQKEVLLEYQSSGKLTIHSINEDARKEINQISYPKSLSEMDKTVLFLASKLKAIVLSSDKVVRKYAKNNSIDYHGMLWIFDQIVDKGLITSQEAILKLTQLINGNMVYRNNIDLVNEMKKRYSDWSK